MDNIEIRTFDIESRADSESRHVVGYGSLYNSRSVDLGGFTEIISPGAFDGVIEKSDVKALLEHDRKRGILARSRNGKGSLSLSVDEKGLKYEFDAPKTGLGDEVLEGLRRGDYSQSSFAFTVASETWEENNGEYTRTINRIDQLFDVSIVANPAYTDTSVACRSLDAFKEKQTEERTEVRDEVKEDVKENPDEKKEEVNDNPDEKKEEAEENPKEDVKEDSDEKKDEAEENPKEDVKEDSDEKKDEVKEDKNDERNENPVQVDIQVPVPENKQEDRHINKNIHKMSNFSLIKTINDVVNNRSVNEDALDVIERGAAEMRKSGLSFSGQIQIPVENRADDPLPTDGAIAATVATQGQEIVATDKLNILEPLRANSILAKCGATILTGLTNNFSIPSYSGTNCHWKGEMVEADNGKGDFDSIEFAPKRLTAYIDISKQFLAQDSVGAEDMLRRDIVNAIKDKLEATIFGDEAGDNNKPAGIFYNADEALPSYTEVCDMEAEIESSNFLGDKVFVMGPTEKALFKQTTVSGTKSDIRLLLQDNEVEGYPVYVSSNVKGYALGDFSELMVCQWGAIDIVIDPYTLATKNAVRLVVNAFFDAKVRRDGAIVAKVLDAGSEA